ncbi:nucleoside recognition domain-containing protein [Chengkuizengella axinellae]|uniref:Nucleoside recognition domain-containing protein n=1 Tax=Chengkuizengella axinellae TaxID=3064388 RepID=A0ABT9IVM2_9BACL|nr:nucleoside recognition domain-containing protein [Chengkuizengella sp. 2205SS18-9]MDP5273396.1 nucleoside recognition domain-containing protein [Chengkuizengella sp. 2205SS18-9]
MSRLNFTMHHRFFTLLLSMSAAFLVIYIIVFPEEAFQSSLQGLNIWWKIVFPSLLPFFILSEVLIAYGFIRMLGVWLEPLMKLLFKVPGVGGWALAMGWTVGYPSSARITANLRQQELITRNEGEKILAVSHASSPIFIINVVAVGFFHHVQLGFFIVFIQMISLLLLGLALNLYYGKTTSNPKETPYKNLVARSLKVMSKAHKQDGRTFGKLLGDAVTTSIQNLMMIGGTMMLFAVMIKMFTLTNMMTIINKIFSELFSISMFFDSMIEPVFTGWFEVHLGAYLISTQQSAPFIWQISLLCSILSWSGFSAHLQVRGLIQNTDLRYRIFLGSRIVQTVFSFSLSFLLWKPYQILFSKTEPSFLNNLTLSATETPFTVWNIWENTFEFMFLLLGTMFIFSAFIAMFKTIYHKFV